MKSNNGYMDRALRSSDPRYARVLTKLGYGRRDMRAAESEPDGLAALRAEYERVVGKRPFNGWDAETLLEKMATTKLVAPESSGTT